MCAGHEPRVSLESFVWAHCLVSSRALDFVLRVDSGSEADTATAQPRSGGVSREPSTQDGVQRVQCMIPGEPSDSTPDTSSQALTVPQFAWVAVMMTSRP